MLKGIVSISDRTTVGGVRLRRIFQLIADTGSSADEFVPLAVRLRERVRRRRHIRRRRSTGIVGDRHY